jgi:hypothetical protein
MAAPSGLPPEAFSPGCGKTSYRLFLLQIDEMVAIPVTRIAGGLDFRPKTGKVKAR